MRQQCHVWCTREVPGPTSAITSFQTFGWPRVVTLVSTLDRQRPRHTIDTGLNLLALQTGLLQGHGQLVEALRPLLDLGLPRSTLSCPNCRWKQFGCDSFVYKKQKFVAGKNPFQLERQASGEADHKFAVPLRDGKPDST